MTWTSDEQLQHDHRPNAKRNGNHQHLGADEELCEAMDHDLGANQSDRRMTSRIRRTQLIGSGGPNRTTGISLKRMTRTNSHDLLLGHEDGARTRLGPSTEAGAISDIHHDQDDGLIKNGLRNPLRLSQDDGSGWTRRDMQCRRMTTDFKQTWNQAESGGKPKRQPRSYIYLLGCVAENPKSRGHTRARMELQLNSGSRDWTMSTAEVGANQEEEPAAGPKLDRTTAVQ